VIRPIPPSHHEIESLFKAFARALRRYLLARSPHGAFASQHKMVALMIAVVNYRTGYPASEKKVLDIFVWTLS
jgi:hypothetical protein